jgi:hypothetical protein
MTRVKACPKQAASPKIIQFMLIDESSEIHRGSKNAARLWFNGKMELCVGFFSNDIDTLARSSNRSGRFVVINIVTGPTDWHSG